MNTNYNTNETATMKIKPEALKSLQYACTYYGLDLRITKVGVVVYCGTAAGGEYWILKLNKNQKAVRKLLHQNHGRNGKFNKLPCKPQELTTELVLANFHNQDNLNEAEMKDFKKVCRYISNHGNARIYLNQQKNAIIQRTQAYARFA